MSLRPKLRSITGSLERTTIRGKQRFVTAASLIPPGKSIAGMTELQVQGNTEFFSSGNARYDWDFSADGTRVWTMWGAQTPTNNFFEYDVSPAWSITPGDWSFTGTQYNFGGSLARTMEWARDGSKLLLLNRWFSSVYRILAYDQSATPFSAAVLGTLTQFTLPDGNEFAMTWKPDGLKVYVSRAAGLYKAFVATIPWDITTLVAAESFDSTVDAGARSSDQMALSEDGVYLYSINSASNLCQWTLSTPWDISTAGSFITGVNVNTGTTLATPRGILVQPSTGDLFIMRGNNTPKSAKVFG